MKKTRNDHLIPVQIWRIYSVPAEPPPESLIVVLKGEEGRFVPISIGCPEGRYLVMAMQQLSFPRPLTHNLLQNLLEKVKGKVHQLVIHTLKDETFHAYLLIQTQDEVFYLDCRPSDGMILTTLMGIPIFMSPEVMEEAGKQLSVLNIEELEELSGSDGAGSDEAPSEEGADDEPAPGPPARKGVGEASPGLAPVEELTELDALKAQLTRLVAEEAYEEAARLRDQISELEQRSDD